MQAGVRAEALHPGTRHPRQRLIDAKCIIYSSWDCRPLLKKKQSYVEFRCSIKALVR